MQMRKWKKSDFKVLANGGYANEVINQIRLKWQRWSHYNPAANKVISVQTNICELGIWWLKSVSEDGIKRAMSQDLLFLSSLTYAVVVEVQYIFKSYAMFIYEGFNCLHV